MQPSLVEALQGAHTLAPNRRYARVLEESYNDWQIGHRLTAWARPSISTLSRYLLREAEELLLHTAPHRCILTPAMQRAVFLGCAPQSLADAHNWYQEVARAWHLSHHYALHEDQPAHLETSNSLIFHEWANAFRALAEEQHYLTEAELPHLLSEAIEESCWQPDKPLLLWGFSQAHPLTPIEAGLVKQLEMRGIASEWPAPEPVQNTKTPRLVECEQPEDELRTIALWVRERLEAAQAPVSIGIAFPGLGPRRGQVERQLLNTLYPQGEVAPDEPRVFDIAGGLPLTSLSVCQSALLLLNFLYRYVEIDELERLLESPFLRLSPAFSAHPDPNPELIEALRRRLPTRIRAQDVEAASRGILSDAMRRHASARHKHRSLTAWLSEFQQALDAAEWPHSADMDSLVYQQAAQLGVLFTEIGLTSAHLGRLSASEAVRELERAAGERYHEVQRSGAPVRVLELDELTPLRFTHLWVAGMRHAAWPATSSPNPFLSRQSQRQVGVPDVTPESRLSRARFVTESLGSVAQELVFSYAQLEDDRQQGASALLPKALVTEARHFVAPARQSLLDLSHPYLASRPVRSETYVDDCAARCEPSECHGNSELVRNQSNCPFRAFAVHRLHVGRQETPSEVPDARALGESAHRALEIAYEALPTQASLREHPDHASLARESAELAVDHVFPDSPEYLKVRQIRSLAALVEAWFACDLERPAYTGMHTEQALEIELEGMQFNLRIDRFDQDEKTGKWIITDYKSTPPAVSSLRKYSALHEPQLSLYAEALRTSAGLEALSLAFGAIGDADSARYLHCSADDRFRKQKSERMRDALVIEQGGEFVRQLIRDFLNGEARVHPRMRACATCHLQSLCRIHSQGTT